MNRDHMGTNAFKYLARRVSASSREMSSFVKTAFNIVAALSILCVAGTPAHGSIFNSPHDMYSQQYMLLPESSTGSSPQCVLCHPVHERDRPRIWDMVPASMERYGSAGIACASCHDGVSIVDRNVDAGLTVFHPDSHGVDPELAPVGTDQSSTGLPSGSVACINCHDPHNSSNRPFLRVPISGLCVRCHKGRGHTGFGVSNTTGSHPVDIEPFDNTGGPTPIVVQPELNVAFPAPYPTQSGVLSGTGHWNLGGHLSFGSFGKIECMTCHAFHGRESTGPVANLLSKDPVNKISNEFCEGCHRGERGDDKLMPPFPNPGGTTSGRTYHPVDDDDANGIGWNVAIADTTERSYYQWGEINPDTDRPTILCTTCHVAHNGMENSPALVPIEDESVAEGVDTFCQICHREPPRGHHGYESGGFLREDIAEQIMQNTDIIGITYGEMSYDQVYCSFCHKAHNAGYGRNEGHFIPILVDKGTEICNACHQLGVSHFMGDPVLPSTYGKVAPSLYRDAWPDNGFYSFYDGEGENATEVTCLSCHSLRTPPEGVDLGQYRLLAPAGKDVEWFDGSPTDYLCTGCHGPSPSTEGGGHSHPYMSARAFMFPTIFSDHLLPDELPVTYTENGTINCHSCHSTHNAVDRGGVYILKVVRGENVDPKAIKPAVFYTELCHSCHSATDY